jgi:hypothetical protein
MSNDEPEDTVKIQIARKVGTDSRGRSVWTKPVEPIELELVSTQMLKRMMASDDDERKDQIRTVANSGDGVLARNTNSLEFEILGEDELRAALKAADGDPGSAGNARVVLEPIGETATTGELSLVTTQMLRKVLKTGSKQGNKDFGGKIDELGGFNPYDKS